MTGSAAQHRGGREGAEGSAEDKDEKMSAGNSSVTEDMMHAPEDPDEDEEESSRTPEERMTFALSCKDFGNEAFKKSDISLAKEKYRVGTPRHTQSPAVA